jgi:POT family proton-dependent oligopeptide transporter
MGSDSNDAFILACIPVIYFYGNLWLKGNVKIKKELVP